MSDQAVRMAGDVADGVVVRASIEVLGPVQPGSLIVLRGEAWDGLDEVEMLDMCSWRFGHDRFLLVKVPEGADVELYGPDDLITAAADAILERARQLRRDA